MGQDRVDRKKQTYIFKNHLGEWIASLILVLFLAENAGPECVL